MAPIAVPACGSCRAMTVIIPPTDPHFPINIPFQHIRIIIFHNDDCHMIKVAASHQLAEEDQQQAQRGTPRHTWVQQPTMEEENVAATKGGGHTVERRAWVEDTRFRE